MVLYLIDGASIIVQLNRGPKYLFLSILQKLMLFPGLEKNTHTHRDAFLF
jgi:hypothetical protein